MEPFNVAFGGWLAAIEDFARAFWGWTAVFGPTPPGTAVIAYSEFTAASVAQTFAVSLMGQTFTAS